MRAAVWNGSNGILAIVANTGSKAANWINSVASQSNGDVTGLNPDGNCEIFVWQELDIPPFRQVGQSSGCLNAGPSIDNRGRFVALRSTCNRTASLSNPDQSIFVRDDLERKLLPLVVGGELTAASAPPQSTKDVAMLTYESNLDSNVDPAICFLNVRDFPRPLANRP